MLFAERKREIRNISDPEKCHQPGNMYLFTVGWRCLYSLAIGIISCPLRQKAWILKCEAFGIRSEKAPGALAQRDGPWRSSREENSEGAIGIVEPPDFESQEVPGYINVEIRYTWAPAHLGVTFKRGRAYGKISFRPDRHHSALWKPSAYSHAVFDRETRDASPQMFYIPSEIPGAAKPPSVTADHPQSRASRRTSPSRPSHANDDWREHDGTWPNWPSGGRNQYSDEDWEVRHRFQDGKQEMADRVGRNRRISEQHEQARKEIEEQEERKKSEPQSTSVVAPAATPVDPPIVTPAATTPAVAPDASTATNPRLPTSPKGPIPAPPQKSSVKSNGSISPGTQEVPSGVTSKVASEVIRKISSPGISSPQTPPPRLAPEKASSCVPSPPVSHAHSAFPAPSTRIANDDKDGSEDFKRLQITASGGPPKCTADRLTRREIANRLSHPAQVYNFLVFWGIW